MATLAYKKILVPVDFSPCSEEAFKTALSLARLFQAEVLVLHVIDIKSLDALNRLGLALPSEDHGQKKRLRHQARVNARRLLSSEETKGVALRRLIAEGAPFVEIVRAARGEQVDLIVMGSYGGFTSSVDKMFFGSTAERVVRTAGCPVLCVPLSAKPTPRIRAKP